MRPLSAKQAAEWCRTQGIALDERGAPTTDGLKRFRLPADASGRSSLVGRQLAAFESGKRILVWITGWGVWPSIDLHDLFIDLRSAAGERRNLHEVPAQLLGRDEFEDLRAIVSCVVASLWDVHVVASGGKRRLFYSHDEWGAAKGVDVDG